MGGKKAVGRNVVWNTAGTLVEAAAGFLVAPLLIFRLGETTYGLWVVLGSLAVSFGLLDLGIRSAVGRQVAYHFARQDRRGVNETLSTALAALAALGALAFVLVAGGAPVFLRMFQVPEAEWAEASVALVLVAANLGVALVLNAFDATLWGFQRFDRLNAVDIPTVVFRTATTFLVVGLAGGGLVALALITIGSTTACGLAKAVLCFRTDPGLRVGRGLVTRPAARAVFGYGGWNLLSTIARVTRANLSSVLIGSLAALGLVTPFSLAARLLNFVAAFLAAVTGVLTPLATAFHARENIGREQQLLLVGGRHSAAIALYLIAIMLFLGRALITLWVGPAFEFAATALAILAIGELLPSTQYVTTNVIQAKARHRALAFAGCLEAATVAGLSVGFIRPFGLVGAAVAVAVPATLFRGLVPLVVATRLLGVPIGRYVRESVLTPLAFASVPATLLALATAVRPPKGWVETIATGFLFTLAYAAAYALMLGPARLWATMGRRKLAAVARPPAESAVPA